MNLTEIYTPAELKLFKKLNSPKKIQDFLDTLKINFEENGETVMSPRFVIRHRKAHCMEGALFAAAALEFHGHRPLMVDLRATKPDYDHVIAVYKQFACWGAITKTNHAILRYREPVYRSIRGLVMSYFHEYVYDNGKKTLREYSKPFDLRFFDRHPLLISPLKGEKKKKVPSPRGGGVGRGENWRTTEKDLEVVPEYLDKIRHYKILNKRQIRNLRKADKIELRALNLVDFKSKYAKF